MKQLLNALFAAAVVCFIIAAVASCTRVQQPSAAWAQAPTPTPYAGRAPRPTNETCVAQPKSAPTATVTPAFYKGKWYYFCCWNCRAGFAASNAAREKMTANYKAKGGK